ncbi:GNAT family N-acetyltransferase [Micromonospora sp. NPDC049051]|uniref:GNAT family N-acetyltransferase n=1 Tax=Micromonospora sp. NPDC049051 TaxID=3364264 RepID=UPI003712E444
MQSNSTLTVRRATPDDAGPLITVLVEAFLDGPVADWLVPDLNDRRTVYFRYFKHVLHHGLRYGRVDTTSDLSAVAIWYTRDEVPLLASTDHYYVVEKATGKYAPKFLLLDAIFETHHPHAPHDYLAYVAVDPRRQSRGVGSALLTTAHQTLDAANRAAYLEASNTRSRDLYLRLGYRQGAPIHLPTQGPLIWRMWRGQPTDGSPAPFPTDLLPRRRPL